MISYKYIDGWDEEITVANLRSLLQAANSKTDAEAAGDVNKTHLANSTFHIIKKVLNTFDKDRSLHGLFSALDISQNRVSPFLASHDYCIKVKSYSSQGEIKLNISPIYRLGLEYPQAHAVQNGSELDKEAIIGLMENTPEMPIDDKHTTYSLGIDAGVAFASSSISHNKEMTLHFNVLQDGVQACLSCENQAMSKMLSWQDLQNSANT